ncbi:MAG: TonB C-terminal domain-containing protein, partial [Kiritimatiellaceae bacterium]|nr:TonB C-terminal domain-containing protein [Kiritimatiellaceae bacterium]
GAGYYDSIKQRIYAVWQQPSGSPIGLTAEATIYVERDGRVSSKRITRRSGNPSFDQSVQNALNATTFLPPPPAGLPSRTITVAFEISR